MTIATPSVPANSESNSSTGPTWSNVPLPPSTRLVLRSVSFGRRLKVYSLPPSSDLNPRHVAKSDLAPILTTVFKSWNRQVSVFEGDRNSKVGKGEDESGVRKFFGKMGIESRKKKEMEEREEEEDLGDLLLRGQMESWTMKSRFDFGPALSHATQPSTAASSSTLAPPPSYQASLLAPPSNPDAKDPHSDAEDLSDDEKSHRLSRPAPTSYPVDEKHSLGPDHGDDDDDEDSDDDEAKPRPALAARREHRAAGLRRLAAVRGLVLNDVDGALALDEDPVPVEGKGKGKAKGKKRWFAKVKISDLETDLFICFDIRKRQWSCDRAFWVGEEGPFFAHQSAWGHITITDEAGATLGEYRRDSWEYRIQGVLTLNFDAEKPRARQLALACLTTCAIMHRTENQRRSNTASSTSAASTTVVVS